MYFQLIKDSDSLGTKVRISIYRFICFSSFICPTIYLSSSDILYLHSFLSMHLVLFLSLYIYFILLAKYKSSLGTNIRIHSFNSTVRLSNLFPAPHICKYFNLSSIYLINNLSVQRSIYPSYYISIIFLSIRTESVHLM